MEPPVTLDAIYRRYASAEVDRFERNLNNLSPDDQNILGSTVDLVKQMRESVELNTRFCSRVNLKAEQRGMENFFRLWVLEWSAEGNRKLGHKFLLDALHQHVDKEKKIWVPGAQLGRLVHDLMKAGYANVTGTEQSPLLLESVRVLGTLRANEVDFRPFATITTNRVDIFDNVRSVPVPDEDPLDFTLSSESPASTDVVVTTVDFFARNSSNLIAAIRNVAERLPPGGPWINFSALAYPRDGGCGLQLGWEEVKTIIEKFFVFEEPESFHCVYYNQNCKAMVQNRVHAVAFRAVRNSASAKDTPPPPAPC